MRPSKSFIAAHNPKIKNSGQKMFFIVFIGGPK
jgi:hypothetical protein